MKQPLLPPVVGQAIALASRAHRSQTRKASDLPYISHPANVALILARAGFDDEVTLAAAWLHDVVEDSDVDMHEIRTAFPAAVADIVDMLSERKHDADGRPISWADRKSAHLERMQSAGLPARAVMLADKLHNLSTMQTDVRNGTQLWDRFNAPREQVLGYYRSMIEITDANHELTTLRAAALQILEELEGHGAG